MGINLTDQFIDEIDAIRRERFPESVIVQAKRCLLDYLGATFAGARMLKEKGNKLLQSLNDSQNSASVIGFNRKAGVLNAALINGLSSHAAELDDGVRFGMVHPGAPIFSALLPVAENEKVRSSNLLAGIVAGYEAAVRIARAVQPEHYNRGYHPTSTCGAIGAAMGIAAMLEFSKTDLKDVLSAVTVAASGMLKVIEDGAELKPFNVGRAAYSGALAAFTARAGFNGLDDVFSGPIGFLSMMTETGDVSCITKENDDSYEIEKVYFKPYASCRHTHPAIEGALTIKKNEDLSPEEIERINVKTYKGIIGKHDHSDVRGVSSAKMSLPYSVAVVLVTGKAGMSEFSTGNIADPEIIGLMKKVEVQADEEITSLVPQKRAAIVEIRTHDGSLYTERVDLPKGEPENPLSDDEINGKFRTLSAYGNKTEEESSAVMKIVWNLETDISSLFQFL